MKNNLYASTLTHLLNKRTSAFLSAVLMVGGFLLLATNAIAQCPASPITVISTAPRKTSTTGTWTAPAGGPYKIRITAKGAKGGNSPDGTGGKGATMQGEFIVASGQILDIVAGAEGYLGQLAGSGGGGGSGVHIGSSSIDLIIAGGDSGGGRSGTTYNGSDCSSFCGVGGKLVTMFTSDTF